MAPKKTYYLMGHELNTWPLAWIEFLWDAELGNDQSGSVDLWEDQVGSMDWVEDSVAGLAYGTDVGIGGGGYLQNGPGARMRANAALTGSMPFVLYFLCRVHYTSNYSTIWRDATSFGAQPQLRHRGPDSVGEMQGAASGNLDLRGTDGINWNPSTGALLAPGENSGWHLLKFLWTPGEFFFSRDNVVAKSGNSPVGPEAFVGHDIWLGTANTWDIALHFGAFYEPAAAEDTAVIDYINNRYGLSI